MGTSEMFASAPFLPRVALDGPDVRGFFVEVVRVERVSSEYKLDQ